MAMWNKNEQAYMQDNKTLFEAFLLADKNGNIINSFGVASNIPIAAGLVDGYGHINKFGATDGDVTLGTIWDGNSSVYLLLIPCRWYTIDCINTECRRRSRSSRTR